MLLNITERFLFLDHFLGGVGGGAVAVGDGNGCEIATIRGRSRVSAVMGDFGGLCGCGG